MKTLDLEILRRAVRDGRIEWRKHVVEKLAERAIPQQAVLQILLEGERIRDYTEDRPFPSALFLEAVAKVARRRFVGRLYQTPPGRGEGWRFTETPYKRLLQPLLG